MNPSASEVERESANIQTKLNSFQTELESLRSQINVVTEENKDLRRQLKKTIEEKLVGISPDAVNNNENIIELQKTQINLLEQEKDDTMKLCKQSQEMVLRLEQEVNDLKDPLKPHLLKLDMQSRQIQEQHAREEIELVQEMNLIREELSKRSKDLVNSQLLVKELETNNEVLRTQVFQKEDDLRNALKKELGYDGTFVALQNSIDTLEVRLENALKEKELARKQQDELDAKLKEMTLENRSLEIKLSDAINHLQENAHLQGIALNENQFAVARERQGKEDHDRLHRTIDELIEQAANKTKIAVEQVRQQYNQNLEKLMQEYTQMESELEHKQAEFEKCLRAKRLAEEELDKALQERRRQIENNSYVNEDLAKRCFNGERERDDALTKLEQLQHSQKIAQHSFETEQSKSLLKQKELNERLEKVTIDLDNMSRDHTMTLNELNELKKKLSNAQTEQNLLQRRMTDLVKRHEEQLIEREKECLNRLTERDNINGATFNELRNLVNRQQRMIVKYKEECHTITAQSEMKINEFRQNIDNLKNRNNQLQSEIADVKRKEAATSRMLLSNTNRLKTLEERLGEAEKQAVEASRRTAKQLVRERLALTNDHHYSSSPFRQQSSSLFNLNSAITSRSHNGLALSDNNNGHLSDGT